MLTSLSVVSGLSVSIEKSSDLETAGPAPAAEAHVAWVLRTQKTRSPNLHRSQWTTQPEPDAKTAERGQIKMSTFKVDQSLQTNPPPTSPLLSASHSYFVFWVKGVQPKSLSQFLIFCEKAVCLFPKQSVFDVKFLILQEGKGNRCLCWNLFVMRWLEWNRPNVETKMTPDGIKNL